MPRINPGLLDRLESKLGITRKRVYARIQEVANRTMLDRHLAALVLASEQGINIQRFSTPEERSEIRRASNGAEAPRPLVAAEPSAARRQQPKRAKPTRQPKDNSVFVVHGRNEALRKSMFEFLRALGLKPMEWGKAVLTAKGANPYIGDVLDSAMARVQAVVVLLSPDDEAKLKDRFCSGDERSTEGKLQGQPRPNVIFEAGLALGRHPEKTLLVQVGKIRGFTDIAGKHVVRLTNDFERRNDVANRLRKIGCKVDTQGSDWTQTGDFTA